MLDVLGHDSGYYREHWRISSRRELDRIGSPMKDYKMVSSWEELVHTSKLVYGESSAMVFFRTIREQPDMKILAPDGNPETVLSC
jgi:hypothetical protein